MAGSGWLRTFSPRPGARVRLVCLPHAGGGASWFSTWGSEVDPTIEVLAVQYPGHEDRFSEPAVDVMEPLADAIAGALRSLAGQPLVLFGHSMGAMVAYEVARRLQRSDPDCPACLVVSGSCAPHVRGGGRMQLDDDALLADLTRLGGTRPDVLEYTDLRTLILPLVRSDYRLVRAYAWRSGAALRCPIGVVLGDRDPEVTEQSARAWGELTIAPSELKLIPGGHFYLVSERSALLAWLQRWLRAIIPSAWPGGP
jgi:pyochelin biosynthesis protein PchC